VLHVTFYSVFLSSMSHVFLVGDFSPFHDYWVVSPEPFSAAASEEVRTDILRLEPKNPTTAPTTERPAGFYCALCGPLVVLSVIVIVFVDTVLRSN
jgi:hypothetical protein